MGITLTYECCAFLQAAVSGAAAAFMYSLRAAVLRRHRGSLAANVSAVMLFAAIFAVWFIMTYRYTRGFFRAYEFLAFALGYSAASLAFGNICAVVFDKIIYFFELILKYLLTPARFLYTILLRNKSEKIQEENIK